MKGFFKRSAQKWLWRLGVMSAVLFVTAALAYHAAPELLLIDSGEIRGDTIVVLGGDPTARPERAAELYREGVAPLVIVSGHGDSDEVARALRGAGVLDSAIRIEDKSGNTWQNAKFSVALLRTLNRASVFRPDGGSGTDSQKNRITETPGSRAPVQRVIIVTSWWHSRRAMACFKKAGPEFEFYSRPSYFGFPRDQWAKTGEAARIRLELVKIVAYAVRYGVISF